MPATREQFEQLRELAASLSNTQRQVIVEFDEVGRDLLDPKTLKPMFPHLPQVLVTVRTARGATVTRALRPAGSSLFGDLLATINGGTQQ